MKDGTDLTYPAIAATQNGQAVLNFTITGPSDFPSAGFAGLDAKNGTGDVQYAAHGAGPQDGFTEYQPLRHGRSTARAGATTAPLSRRQVDLDRERVHRPDVHARAVRGDSPFGTCSGTRGSIGNWDTRISQITP